MSPPDRPATILVVDDEPALLRVVVTVLERQGYTVLSASAGDEAIKLFDERSDEIDGVVLDVVIPPDGVEAVLAHMLAVRPDLMVIVSSGDTLVAPLSERMREQGGVFLRKPFVPDQLLDALKSGLAGRH